jgi:HNH endonuclease
LRAGRGRWHMAENFPGSDCTLSTRAVNRKGYPVISIKGKTYLEHRKVWESEHGDIPEGLFVLHRCDTPGCINVEHLFLGTNQDNARDMVRKGRQNNQRKTHCPWGHEYNEENTRVSKGRRWCRTCERIRIR